MWIRPNAVEVERNQFLVGNLNYEEDKYYNHGLMIVNEYLYFFAGDAVEDISKNRKNKKIYYFISENLSFIISHLFVFFFSLRDEI